MAKNFIKYLQAPIAIIACLFLALIFASQAISGNGTWITEPAPAIAVTEATLFTLGGVLSIGRMIADLHRIHAKGEKPW